MLRTLLTPRWLGLVALAVVVAVAAVWLGTWQYGRHEQKVANRDRVEAHYAADPVPLDQALAGGTAVAPDDEWTRVVATGRYDAQGRLFVRNRPNHGVYGYEVLAALRTDAGTVLVSRGWARNTESADVLPDVPPEPDGDVEVTGWLRPSEPSLGRDLPAGQLASVDVAAAEAQLGTALVDGYLVLQSERLPDGSEPGRPEPTEPPTTDLGPNFAYALQWWLITPVGFVLVWVFLRREHREQWERDNPREALVAARQRRTRIWDEEDE